ncbi:serine protease AprX [bacterium BMS3Bbin04]|nr:serine protease AprX [bacterium BMS3Bbin04]
MQASTGKRYGLLKIEKMMKEFGLKRIVIAALVLFCGLLMSQFAQAEQSYWVEFTDKGQWESLSQGELETAAFDHGLTQRAIDRRELEGLAGDDLITLDDLPPDAEYVAMLGELGAQLCQQSWWFNLVSVRADDQVMAQIAELPFVKRVHRVAAMSMARSSYEVVEEFDGNPAPGPGIDTPGSYGRSYLQALQVNAVEAHRQGITGKGVLMVVIDGGFELSHECFENLDVIAEWDVTDNDDYTGQEPEDARGQTSHGTGCLSEIAGYSPGNLIGIAYEASFVLVKSEYIPTETVQEEDDWVAGLEWAERLGASVGSSSLGYTDWYNAAMYDGWYPLTSRAITRAFEKGVVFVTSASNDGPQPMTLGAPADCYGGLSIGAIDSLGTIGRFSSRGPTADGRIKPDLVTRGVQTLLASPQTQNNYAYWNGTSMACPIGAGVVALVRQAQPEWSAAEVMEALRMTADRADHPDNTYGWGIPDVMKAIAYEGE